MGNARYLDNIVMGRNELTDSHACRYRSLETSKCSIFVDRYARTNAVFHFPLSFRSETYAFQCFLKTQAEVITHGHNQYETLNSLRKEEIILGY